MAGVTGLHCLSDPWPPRDPCRHYSFLVCCIPSPVIGTLPIFGIGAGWLKEETEIMGGDFPHRWAQTRDAILAMKELWTKEEAGALVKRGQFKLPAFGTLGTFGACHVPGPLQTDGLPLCSLTQSLASDMCPSTPRS